MNSYSSSSPSHLAFLLPLFADIWSSPRLLLFISVLPYLYVASKPQYVSLSLSLSLSLASPASLFISFPLSYHSGNSPHW